MSQSSLWVMDTAFNGEEIEEFSNSWLLTPQVMDILFAKYMPEEAYADGKRLNFMSLAMFNDSLHRELNTRINNTPIQEDRVLWEIAMQQVFSTKDKLFVARSLKNFLKNNHPFTKEYGEHIHERFEEVADAILHIDEVENPYFIFKGTSVDDTVETWFYGENEETGERGKRTLRAVDEVVCEFVRIEEEEIKGFVNNLDYFEKSR